MILAGVLLKLGAYGFLRLVLPLYPEEARTYAGCWLSWRRWRSSLARWPPGDKPISSGWWRIPQSTTWGLWCSAWPRLPTATGTQNAVLALNGAVLQMFNHGLSAAGMFFLVGVIYERTHTRNLNEYGGLFRLIPVYGGILIFTSMASLGLPGLGGFISEFLVVRGSWPIFTLFTALSMIGLFFTGAYILKGIKQVLHGPLNENWIGHLSEINAREVFVIAPLMVLMLIIGIAPSWILEVINRAVTMLFG